MRQFLTAKALNTAKAQKGTRMVRRCDDSTTKRFGGFAAFCALAVKSRISVLHE